MAKCGAKSKQNILLQLVGHYMALQPVCRRCCCSDKHWSGRGQSAWSSNCLVQAPHNADTAALLKPMSH